MSRVLPWLTVCQDFKYLICIGICLWGLFQNSFCLNSELLFALISYISAQYLLSTLMQKHSNPYFYFEKRSDNSGLEPNFIPYMVGFSTMSGGGNPKGEKNANWHFFQLTFIEFWSTWKIDILSLSFLIHEHSIHQSIFI